ncbi:Uncharacterised protein [Bordetella pertussis]|nr:Uncharacterised protein [Bordetella pertussis]
METVAAGGGQAGEVIALLGAGEQALGLLAQGRDLVGRRAFRHPHEDLRQHQHRRPGLRRLPRLGLGLLRRRRTRGLGGGGIAFLVFQEGIHFSIGNNDIGVHGALAQAVHADIVAQGLAVLLPGHAAFLDFGAHGRRRDLVARGNHVDRLVDLRLVDADAHAVGFLALQALHDQALQHLLLQGALVGHLDAAFLQVRRGQLGRLAHFAQGNDILVDDRGDTVDELLARRRRGRLLVAFRRRLGRLGLRGRQGQARRQHQRQYRAGHAAQGMQATHHSYLSKVVPVGVGGTTDW